MNGLLFMTRDDYQHLQERDKLSVARDTALEPKKLQDVPIECIKKLTERYILRKKSSWWADITLSTDGFVNIQSDYGNYHYRWCSFGDDIKKFLIGCDYSYLAGKFGMNLPRIFNQKDTIKRIRKDIIEFRKTGDIDRDQSRDAWNALDLINKTERIESTEEWGRVILETCIPRIVYNGDLPSMPCVTEINQQLRAFLIIIWPEFVKVLKTN